MQAINTKRIFDFHLIARNSFFDKDGKKLRLTPAQDLFFQNLVAYHSQAPPKRIEFTVVPSRTRGFISGVSSDRKTLIIHWSVLDIIKELEEKDPKNLKYYMRFLRGNFEGHEPVHLNPPKKPEKPNKEEKKARTFTLKFISEKLEVLDASALYLFQLPDSPSPLNPAGHL